MLYHAISHNLTGQFDETYYRPTDAIFSINAEEILKKSAGKILLRPDPLGAGRRYKL